MEIATPFNIGDTWWIDVAQPANTYISSDGSFGDSTLGLVNDDDEALPETTIVKAITLGLAYRALEGITDGAEADMWGKRATEQLARAALLKGVFRQRLNPSGRGTWNAFTSTGRGNKQIGGQTVSSRRGGRNSLISRRWV